MNALSVRQVRRQAEKVANETAWAQARRVDPAPMRITLRLGWPPTVNTYWRVWRTGKLAGTVFISDEGKDYRKHVAEQVLAQRIPTYQLTGRLGLIAMCCPPDGRARDLDNLPKGILDSLKHAAVIRDDRFIDDLRLYRASPVAGGLVLVDLWEIPGGPTDSYSLPLEAPRRMSAEEAFS